MSRLLVLALLAPLALPARAQEAPPPPEGVVHLTLAEAVARARERSARLQALGAQEKAASEGVRGARSGRLPQLDLSASYFRNSDVDEFTLSLPGQPPRVIFPNLPDNGRARATLSYPLYTGGRTSSQITAATESQRAAVSDREAAAAELALETQSAYVGLVSARESARVLAEAEAAYESHLQDARHRQELGMAAPNEVLAVTVERERAELQRVQAESAALIAHANLQRLVDLPPATRIEADPLAEDVQAPPGDLEALVAEALAARPELAALRARVRALDAQARVARSSNLPQAGVQLLYDYANPNPRVLPLSNDWNGTWSVGGSVSWSAFDGGRTKAAAAQATAQAEAVRAQATDAERRVRLEVTARSADLATARAGLAVSGRALEAARENLRVVKDRYGEGVASSSDLLDAENVLLRAGLERTQATAQLQVAQAALTRALGR